MTAAEISLLAFIGATAIVAFATAEPRCMTNDEFQDAIMRRPDRQPILIMGRRDRSCVTAVEFRLAPKP